MITAKRADLFYVVPLADAAALGAIAAAGMLYWIVPLNNFEYFFDESTSRVHVLNWVLTVLRFGLPAAFGVFVLELVIHRLFLRRSLWVRRSVLLPFIDALVLGCVAGGLMLYAGFQHNPQSVFYGPGIWEVHWAQSAIVFLSWALPVGAVVFFVELIVHSAISRVARRA